MKQAAQKKRKVFRTLIRIIHVGGKSEKSIRDDSHYKNKRKEWKAVKLASLLFRKVNMRICDKEVLLVELKTILTVVLCLAIVGGAVYLHIKQK